MKCVRRCFFETNSSSSHSLSIDMSNFDQENLDYEDLPIINKKLEAEGGEFGWEVKSYNDFHTKFNYLITYLFSGIKNKDDIDNIIKYNKNYILLKDIINEKLGLQISFDSIIIGDYYPFGYIDHQSEDVAVDAFVSYDTLNSFLFNKNSYLFTDNDNYSIDEDDY